MNTYFLSIIFISFAFLISYSLGLITLRLIQKITSKDIKKFEIVILPIGFGVISLISNYLYFYLNVSSKIIALLIIFLAIISFLLNLLFFKFIKVSNKEILSLYIISSIFIVFLIFKGEQFFIFRGNHWDSINYLSTALSIRDYNYLDIFTLRDKNILPSDAYIYTGDLIYRPLVKLLLSFFLNFKIESYFFSYCLFKIFLICNIFLACKFFLKNLNIKNNLIYSFTFIFSFWLIYIIEIDALSHLASFPFFIIGISLVINKNKTEIFKNKNYEILFFINSILVLTIYSEIFLVYLYIILIFLLLNFGFKTTLRNLFNKKLITIILFLILTIPTYELTYKVIYLNIVGGVVNSNVDWWGYYGSFILGKIENFSDLDEVNIIKNTFASYGFSYKTFISIVSFVKDQNLIFTPFNILPSFFGFYFLTNLNVNFILNFLISIFLNIIIIRIIYKNFREYKVYKNFKNTFVIATAISFFSISIFSLILNLNVWIIIKIYTYLSFFIFLFLIYNSKIFANKKLNFSFSIVLILIILSFPVYKYNEFNFGIGKLDNFPSILNPELKKNINWITDSDKVKSCTLIKFYNKNKIILNYLSVKFKSDGFNHINQGTFLNTRQLKNDRNCELILEKRSFIIKEVY